MSCGFGMGGQRLFVVPDLKIVVVILSGRYDSPFRNADSIILNDSVLSAATRWESS